MHACMHAYIQTDRQTDIHTDIHTYIHMYKHILYLSCICSLTRSWPPNRLYVTTHPPCHAAGGPNVWGSFRNWLWGSIFFKPRPSRCAPAESGECCNPGPREECWLLVKVFGGQEWVPLGYESEGESKIHIWVNYNDLTTTSLGLIGW